MKQHLETLSAPSRYSVAQLKRAWKIQALLAMICPDRRGKLVLCEPPDQH